MSDGKDRIGSAVATLSDPMIDAAGDKRRRPRAVLRALVAATVLAWASPLSAADDENTRYDGLDQPMRELLYNSTTAMVARLNLPQLRHDQLVEMVNGAFDPATLAILRTDNNFDKTVEEFIGGPAGIAGALSEAKYEQMTLVMFQYFGSVQGLGALPLGVDLPDAAWLFAKALLEEIFAQGGFKLTLNRRSNYVQINPAGATLPGVDYSASVKETVLLGLAQPTGTPAFAFVSPMNNELKAVMGSVSDYGNIGPTLANADYIGGYIVSGSRPEIHLYARFASADTAGKVKATYDAGWVQQLAKTDQNDKSEAEGKTLFVMRSMMTGGEFDRRIQRATEMTVFNNVVRIDLDTTDLRTITTAVVDRYFRQPPAPPK